MKNSPSNRESGNTLRNTVALSLAVSALALGGCGKEAPATQAPATETTATMTPPMKPSVKPSVVPSPVKRTNAVEHASAICKITQSAEGDFTAVAHIPASGEGKATVTLHGENDVNLGDVHASDPNDTWLDKGNTTHQVTLTESAPSNVAEDLTISGFSDGAVVCDVQR